MIRSLSLLLVFSLAACAASDASGPPAPAGGHHLTIVGANAVLVAGGVPAQLRVRYHDDADQPIAGEVSFSLSGDPRGGDISQERLATDGEGLAAVDVLPGNETTFTVTATAAEAEPVTWTVTIGPGGTPLQAAGTYAVESQFDLVGGVPGPVGDVINGLLDMTDDPTNPSTWLIDQLLARIDTPVVTSAVNALRPGLDISLNTALLELSPDFVATIINVADDLGQVSRRFGTVSTLIVDRDFDAGLFASHELNSYLVEVEGETHELSLADIGAEPSIASDIEVILRGKVSLSFATHELPVAYGKLLVFVLREVIVPAASPGATNLGELLTALVDCTAIGTWLSQEIGVGPPLVYDIACRTGLSLAGSLIEEQLATVDGPGILAIGGEARPRDQSGDGAVDLLEPGAWEGALRLGDSASALDRPAQTFRGQRQ